MGRIVTSVTIANAADSSMSLTCDALWNNRKWQ
jgi:hypothetical protein